MRGTVTPSITVEVLENAFNAYRHVIVFNAGSRSALLPVRLVATLVISGPE